MDAPMPLWMSEPRIDESAMDAPNTPNHLWMSEPPE